MSDATVFELEVGRIIVQTLNLKIDPSSIDPLAPLFGEGLGLDSIDALEIALAISKEYGYELRSDDPDNAKILSCLRSLCEAINNHRTK